MSNHKYQLINKSLFVLYEGSFALEKIEKIKEAVPGIFKQIKIFFVTGLYISAKVDLYGLNRPQIHIWQGRLADENILYNYTRERKGINYFLIDEKNKADINLAAINYPQGNKDFIGEVYKFFIEINKIS